MLNNALGLFLIGLSFGFLLKIENALFMYFESILIICLYLSFFSNFFFLFLFYFLGALFLAAFGIYEKYGFLLFLIAYIEIQIRENKNAFAKGKYALVALGQLVGFKLNNFNFNLRKENLIFLFFTCLIGIAFLIFKKRMHFKISFIHSIISAFVIGFIQVGIFVVVIDFVIEKYRVLSYKDLYSMGLVVLIFGVIIFSILGMKINKEKILWFCSLLSAFACVYIYFGSGYFNALSLMLLLILSGILYPLTINLLNKTIENKIILIGNSTGAISVILLKNVISIWMFIFCFLYLFYFGFKNYKNSLNKKYEFNTCN